MSIFKEKKNPKKVIAHFNPRGERSSKEEFDVEIVIPEGFTFKPSTFYESARLLDKEGQLVRVYEWKLGYEIIYEFFY